MTSPLEQRLLLWVVVWIIVLREGDFKPLAYVTLILCIKCVAIVLWVTHHENIATVLGHAKEHTCLLALSAYDKVWTCLD